MRDNSESLRESSRTPGTSGASTGFVSSLISSSRRRRRTDSSDEALSNASNSRPKRRHRTSSALRQISQLGSSVMSWGHGETGQSTTHAAHNTVQSAVHNTVQGTHNTVQPASMLPPNIGNSEDVRRLIPRESRESLWETPPEPSRVFSPSATSSSLSMGGVTSTSTVPGPHPGPHPCPSRPPSSTHRHGSAAARRLSRLLSVGAPEAPPSEPSSSRNSTLFPSSTSSLRLPGFPNLFSDGTSSEQPLSASNEPHQHPHLYTRQPPFSSPFNPLSRTTSSSSPSLRESLFNIPRSISTRNEASSSIHSAIAANMPRRRRAMNSDLSDVNTFEGQAVVLSRLLAIAASVTANSLVGSTRSETGVALGRYSEDTSSANNNSNSSSGTLQDDSFQGFLNGLSNGLLANELANHQSEDGRRNPHNFFRMFRFSPGEDAELGEESARGRLIPVLIVGVRAVENNEDQYNADFSFFGASSSRSIRMNRGEGGDQDHSEQRQSEEHTSEQEQASTSANEEQQDRSLPTWRSDRRDELLDELFETGNNGAVPLTASASSSSSSSLGGRPAAAARRVNRQSWIVYVVGGSYPENHPILLAPSLFTDNPTYEDLLVLENFLGQAKPAVATKEDINSSGGLLIVGSDEDNGIQVSATDKCLVCLSLYESGEECRQLKKCGHMFHRECIDQWLTIGRNSCPLCRSEGVTKTSDEVDDRVVC